MNSCNKPPVTKPHVEFKCEVCGNLFSNKSNLVKHNMNIHSISKSKLIPCGLDNCQFWSDSKSEIKKHITIHHSSKPKLPCTLCEAEFCSSGGLQKH